MWNDRVKNEHFHFFKLTAAASPHRIRMRFVLKGMSDTVRDETGAIITLVSLQSF
jgi:hypothetical protein